MRLSFGLVTTLLCVTVVVAPAGGGTAVAAPDQTGGTAWVVVPSPNVTDPSTGDRLSTRLQGVAFTGTDDGWAVGFSNGRCITVGGDPLPAGVSTCATQDTLIERWDGTGWTIVASPNPSIRSNQLRDVTCVSRDDCWAVGFYSGGATGVYDTSVHTLILHWDGTSWTQVASPRIFPIDEPFNANNELYGVTCVSRDDCWAVGRATVLTTTSTSSRTQGQRPLAVHWDGTSWSVVTPESFVETDPSASPSGSDIFRRVTCVSGDDCWAVGWTGNFDTATNSLSDQRTLAMHWDGTGWSRVDSPNPPSAGSNGDPRKYHLLYDVTCAVADDCWAVGESSVRRAGGDLVAWFARWDGTSWTTVPAAEDVPHIDWPFRFNGLPHRESLRGVSCLSPDDCWAIGSSWTPGGRTTLAQHWDGTSWNIAPSADKNDKVHHSNSDELVDVACAGADDCLAVGRHRGEGSVNTLTLRTATVAFAADSPTRGAQGDEVTVSAQTRHLASGTAVTFTLGSDTQTAVTDADGLAQATFRLTEDPGTYPLGALLAGTFYPADSQRGSPSFWLVSLGDAGYLVEDGPLASEEFTVESGGGGGAPSASLTVTPASGTAPLQVTLDASGSSDPDGAITSYAFEFGDGTKPVTQSTPTVEHTYREPGGHTAVVTITDSEGKSATAAATVTVQAPPTATCFEDYDQHFAYQPGWHLVKDSDASGGYFHVMNARGRTHGLTFAFQAESAQETLRYFYATSTKGGSADVYLDGDKVGTVSYNGDRGSLHEPVFGAPAEFPLDGAGTHTLELRNVSGPASVDKLCLSAGGVSDAQPSAGPGATTFNTVVVDPGQPTAAERLTVPWNAQTLSVVAESDADVPYELVMLDPAGNVLGTAQASSEGVARLQAPVDASGMYVIQLVNHGLGPVEIWSAATPQLQWWP